MFEGRINVGWSDTLHEDVCYEFYDWDSHNYNFKFYENIAPLYFRFE